MQLKNAVAIVTGSSSGIGAASAKAFAAKGCNVVINYVRSEKEAHEVVKAVEQTGAQAVLIKGDVSEDAACRRLAQAALDKWGRIDVLVNNAGTTKFVDQRNLDGLDADDFLRIYRTNVVGAYQMIRACAPTMKKQGAGAVVNVASIAGLTGQASSTAYAASKGALNSLTLALARVLGPEIRMNAICPGFVDNRWTQQGLAPDQYATMTKTMAASTALQRFPVSENIADVIVWLAESAEFMTGEIVRVDAGSHLGATARALGIDK